VAKSWEVSMDEGFNDVTPPFRREPYTIGEEG
jgi:hypothetical protein